jgi:aspartate/methionine/tyrosine aminotransferase
MTVLADRYSNLGTETAFAVSAEAAALAKTGKKIYPFHLGDINLPTPQNITDAMLKAISNGKTGYCPNQGIAELREALAENINSTRKTNFTAENVSIQPGGKPVINKFLLALMNPGDEVLYPNPGFPIYESLIRFYGGRAVPYGFREGKKNFEIRVDQLEDLITPRTKLLILNDLHNPTGAEAQESELAHIADLARKNDLYILCDEAYFDVRYEGQSRSLVMYEGLADRCVILYTFSKKYCMTGWRIGAAIGSKELIDAITKFNVNDESCTSHFIQYAAIEALKGPTDEYKKLISVLKDRRDTAVGILNSIEGVRCYNPNATFYLFPNMTEAMKRRGLKTYEELRRGALEETGVSFCTRLHFGTPLPDETQYYIRLAYSGIAKEQITEGLTHLKGFLES